MTVSPKQFKEQFPAFKSQTDEYIQLFINDATAEVNSAVWGSKADLGIKYRTADLLASQPMGENAKLDPKGHSVYWYKYQELLRQVSYGFRVIGV